MTYIPTARRGGSVIRGWTESGCPKTTKPTANVEYGTCHKLIEGPSRLIAEMFSLRHDTCMGMSVRTEAVAVSESFYRP